jgi:hypothetical protein
MPKPKCVRCDSQDKTVQLYWCDKNILKTKIKTYYCASCAQYTLPNQEPLDVGTVRYPGTYH